MSDFRIVCLTSDKYIWAVRPFMYLLKKYWQPTPPVLIAGFSQPPFRVPAGAEFHSIGKFSDYPVNRWSDAVIKLLDEIPDEVFIPMLEDFWIIAPVDTNVVKMAYDYMIQFEYVARLDLTGDRLWANGGDVSLYGRLGHVDLVWSDPHSQYHMSTMPAFWRKRHLKRVLIPGETPWQVELQGTPRLASLHREVIVLGTNVWPVRIHLGFRGGDHGSVLLDGLPSEDVKAMKALGLLEPFGVK